MKEAMTKVIDVLTKEDFHGAFQKLSERYNKCIAAGGDYFEGDYSFICVLSMKVPLRKKSGNLFKWSSYMHSPESILENEAWDFLRFKDTNRSFNPGLKIKPANN